MSMGALKAGRAWLCGALVRGGREPARRRPATSPATEKSRIILHITSAPLSRVSPSPETDHTVSSWRAASGAPCLSCPSWPSISPFAAAHCAARLRSRARRSPSAPGPSVRAGRARRSQSAHSRPARRGPSHRAINFARPRAPACHEPYADGEHNHSKGPSARMPPRCRREI